MNTTRIARHVAAGTTLAPLATERLPLGTAGTPTAG
jgi:hypothetical protein